MMPLQEPESSSQNRLAKEATPVNTGFQLQYLVRLELGPLRLETNEPLEGCRISDNIQAVF